MHWGFAAVEEEFRPEFGYDVKFPCSTRNF